MTSMISPNLITDVLQNADPARVNSATRRLHDLAVDRMSGEFRSALVLMEGETLANGITASLARSQVDESSHSEQTLRGPKSEAPETHVAFERMVLRNLLETLLPDAKSGAFGNGPSADVWRSLASDQLAGVYAENGGLGIANMLSDVDSGVSERRGAEWPYFVTDQIVAFSG